MLDRKGTEELAVLPMTGGQSLGALPNIFLYIFDGTNNRSSFYSGL